MKNKLSLGTSEKALILNYIIIAILPFFTAPNADFLYAFKNVFINNPINILFIISPVLIYALFRINGINDKKQNFYIIAFCILCVLSVIENITSSESYLFTIFILIISVVFININDITIILSLIPGLFLTKLGIPFLIVVYIPVLLLLCIKTNTKKEYDGKKTSSIYFYAYLYILVLAALLIFTRHISLDFYVKNFHPYFRNVMQAVSGSLLLMISAILFVIRTIKNKKKQSAIQTAALLAYAVYPIIFTAVGCIYNVISVSVTPIFYIAMIMYILGNIQFDLIFSCKSIIPQEKIKPFLIAAGIVFCAFSFR